MTLTLRDRLAQVLGPGNDDRTAYAQADAVLNVLKSEIQQLEDRCADTANGDLEFRGRIVRQFDAWRQPV